jgi:hypothetical protein
MTLLRNVLGIHGYRDRSGVFQFLGRAGSKAELEFLQKLWDSDREDKADSLEPGVFGG